MSAKSVGEIQFQLGNDLQENAARGPDSRPLRKQGRFPPVVSCISLCIEHRGAS